MRIEVTDSGRVRVGTRDTELVGGVDPVVQVYQRFLNELLDRIDRHAVLHAAALVDRRGRALLLAAPSGHGKTSLTVELLMRGYRFLGDDYAPLDLGRSQIEPFPRTIGLTADGSERLPEPFRAAAHAPGVKHLFGKALLDVGTVLGPAVLADGPARLGRIVVLSDSSDDPATVAVEITARLEDAGPLEAALGAIGAVDITRQDTGPLRTWILSSPHATFPAHEVSAVVVDDRVLFSNKRWSRRPSFTDAPHASELMRREAAELLGRELLNRRSGGGLLRRYDGSLPRLFLDVAYALVPATCWRVVPGNLAATADLIDRLA